MKPITTKISTAAHTPNQESRLPPVVSPISPPAEPNSSAPSPIPGLPHKICKSPVKLANEKATPTGMRFESSELSGFSRNMRSPRRIIAIGRINFINPTDHPIASSSICPTTPARST